MPHIASRTRFFENPTCTVSHYYVSSEGLYRLLGRGRHGRRQWRVRLNPNKVRDASVHQAFSAFQKGSIRMVFSSDVTQSDLEKDVLFREDGARFVQSRFMSKFRVNFVIFSVAAFLLCSGARQAFSQSTSANKRETLEETSGTSIRNFDALRALSSDYLSNPDGGETPVDEDDLWIPNMSLGKKPESTKKNDVRVISYNNGKTTTETRSLTPHFSSSTGSSKTGITTTQYSVSTASNTAPIKQTQNIEPLGGFSDYSLNSLNQETTVANSAGGFADYQLDATQTPYVAMLNQEDVASDNLSNSVIDPSFPSIDVFDETAKSSDFSMPSSNTVDEVLPIGYNDAPFVNTGLDDLLSDSASVDLPVAPAPNQNQEESVQPVVDSTPFPETELPSFDPAPVDTAQPTDVPQETESIEDFATLPTQEYTPIDLLSEPTEDHTVINDAEAPFRESYRVSELSTPETLPAKDESNEKTSRNEKSLEDANFTEAELKNLVVEDVRISGLEMTAQQFNKIVKTRIGAKFNQQRLEEDKRALLQTKQFIDVSVSTSWSPDNPDKVIVNFDLTPRRMMRYIKIVGNRKISKHDILEELSLKPGESRMDPYEVENGRLRIIEFYKSKDYGEPHVEILRGNRPEDVGVVYLIDEGMKQRVLKTTFVGNTIVSSARLHSLVSVKPGVLYFIGGTFTRERLEADVEKLLEYYRNLGYFDARIDREYEESRWFGGLGKDNAWVSVRYIIDEGPRYKIRNFLFSGNRVVSDKDLEAKLKVKRGSYYRFDEIEADRIALRYKYQDLGYVRADITPNQIFTDEVGVVDIRYDVVEDHRYRVRDVIVDYVGTESRTMTPVVLNMLDVSPGELLNGKKIRMSENTLRQSGYFNDKPDGQLPEIAVIPDETKSYRLNSKGSVQVAREGLDKEKDKEKKNDEEETTRGQNPSRITRGQSPVLSDTSTRAYKSYDVAETSGSTSQGFLAYGPSRNSAQSEIISRPISSNNSTILGQTRQIPSGFSTYTTSQSSSTSSGSYQSYDSPPTTGSQFTDGLDYANSSSANLLNANAALNENSRPNSGFVTSESETAPGFSDGVYGSIGKEVLDPITPDEDEIYDGDVLVKVQEGRTGMFQASVGVNSDYGLVGNLSFTERNFNLFRWPTSLCRADGWNNAFRGGGQIFSFQASPGTNVQSYRVSWDVPNVFNTKYLFGVTGLYGERSYDEWFEARYGGELRVGRQWTPRFSTTLNGGMYNVKISDPAVSFVPDLNEVLGVNRMYTVGLTATYDTRNHPYSPSAGYLIKGSAEAGLGDYNFPRVTLDGRYYKTLHQRVDGTGRWVLGFSTHMGWTGDDTPIFERYYGGGSQNLRGFEYREVTPRYQQSGFGIGGNFEFYNTVEFFVPISGGDEFQLAVFCDTGTVAESIKNWGRYRVAPGVGLRFSIPMLGPAPLALDFSFPISKDPNDVTEVFTFNLSGSR